MDDDDVIIIDSEDSENSIVEVEIPRKPTPPLIDIDEEEIIINVAMGRQKSVVAKDLINKDKELSVVPKIAVSQTVNTPIHWTSDMVKFYDDDWGEEEQFIVEKLQEKMDKTPSLWVISEKDKFRMRNKIRINNTKCWNCGQRGHQVSLCPEPPYIPKCHMCGTEGHKEYCCPNSKCLNCGNHSREYVICCFKCRNQICSRCQMFGHNFINCPDHWRLFHLTTGTTSVKVPNENIYKSEKDLWCCNCGKQGHHQTKCLHRNDCGIFSHSLPFVISYQKAFKYNYSKNKLKGKLRKKNEEKAEKILRINPMNNKIIKKDKVQFKNKFKRFKKNKKNKKNKKGDKAFLII